MEKVMVCFGAAIVIALTGTLFDVYSKTSMSSTPAKCFEVGDVVNSDYVVVGTDKKSELWVRGINDNVTYKADCDSSGYKDKNIVEKAACTWTHRPLSDFVSITVDTSSAKLDETT